MENNSQEQKKLLDLLKQLSDIQAQNMQLSFAIAARDARNAVTSRVNTVTDFVTRNAKQFGAKATKLAADYVAGKEGATEIKGYEAAIKEKEAEYEAGLKGIFSKRGELQAEEIKAMIKKSQVQAKIGKNENKRTPLKERLDALDSQMTAAYEELEQAKQKHEAQNIPEIARRLSGISKEYESVKGKIDKLDNEKDRLQDEELKPINERLAQIKKQLHILGEEEQAYELANLDVLMQIDELEDQIADRKALIPKQNLVQKMLGFFFNKTQGPARFTANVIGKIAQGTKRIVMTELPKLGKGIAAIPGKAMSAIVEQYQNIKSDLIAAAEEQLKTEQARQEELKMQKTGQKEPETPIKPEKNQGTEEQQVWGYEVIRDEDACL